MTVCFVFQHWWKLLCSSEMDSAKTLIKQFQGKQAMQWGDDFGKASIKINVGINYIEEKSLINVPML